MAQQLSALNKKLEKLDRSPIHPCGIVVDLTRATNDDQSITEQVNYLGNQSRPSQNDPYSNTYNVGWRNHPNFSWGSNQGQRNNINPQNANRPYQPPFQRQQPFQSPPLSVPTQPKQAQNTSIEVALKELTLSTSSFI
ncbi:hypothetical protein PIB30_024638 [Stylosanthes scabra]|uniref:Uncharacterized protein n=1 Tax=Stylosanthes scabra TaxID=79078 RepID=A0ABU6X7X4_9FABA|nr:hypothetical protein [Stylosanthes scabra]